MPQGDWPMHPAGTIFDPQVQATHNRNRRGWGRQHPEQ